MRFISLCPVLQWVSICGYVYGIFSTSTWAFYSFYMSITSWLVDHKNAYISCVFEFVIWTLETYVFFIVWIVECFCINTLLGHLSQQLTTHCWDIISPMISDVFAIVLTNYSTHLIEWVSTLGIYPPQKIIENTQCLYRFHRDNFVSLVLPNQISTLTSWLKYKPRGIERSCFVAKHSSSLFLRDFYKTIGYDFKFDIQYFPPGVVCMYFTT